MIRFNRYLKLKIIEKPTTRKEWTFPNGFRVVFNDSRNGNDISWGRVGRKGALELIGTDENITPAELAEFLDEVFKLNKADLK